MAHPEDQQFCPHCGFELDVYAACHECDPDAELDPIADLEAAICSPAARRTISTTLPIALHRHGTLAAASPSPRLSPSRPAGRGDRIFDAPAPGRKEKLSL